jgi:hypothetical protein
MDLLKTEITDFLDFACSDESLGFGYSSLWTNLFTGIIPAVCARKSSDIIMKYMDRDKFLNLPTDKGLFYQRYEMDGNPDPRAWCNCDNARQLDQDALKFIAISKFSNLRIDLEKIKDGTNESLSALGSITDVGTDHAT